jgi:microcin C transport system substrate-binding protein
MRAYFSSGSAKTKGSYNLAGIENPAIDALIEKMIAADTRAELTTACRAFDRIFRAGRYWVPQWYNKTHRLAYWDMFERPENLPRYQIDASGSGERVIWWHDAAKASKLEQSKP